MSLLVTTGRRQALLFVWSGDTLEAQWDFHRCSCFTSRSATNPCRSQSLNENVSRSSCIHTCERPEFSWWNHWKSSFTTFHRKGRSLNLLVSSGKQTPGVCCRSSNSHLCQVCFHWCCEMKCFRGSARRIFFDLWNYASGIFCLEECKWRKWAWEEGGSFFFKPTSAGSFSLLGLIFLRSLNL